MIKTKSMRIRITDEEWQHAEKASVLLFGTPNKSRLLRKLLRDYIGMGLDLTEHELRAFREAVKQLTGIARNLNQITSRIHANEKNAAHVTVDYLERLQDSVTLVNDELKRYISHTLLRYQAAVRHGNEER